LTAGCVPEIKRRLNVPIVATLQGDDTFLRGMPQPQQSLAIAEISRLGLVIDGFIAHSRAYADSMADYLGLERQKIAVTPLGIDTRDFAAVSQRNAAGPPMIGYLARLAPEKGLHILAEAFIRLKQMPGMEKARLSIAGWLGEKDRPYADEVFARLRDARLGDAFEYLGEVQRQAKLAFLASLDVLAVPTTHQEPKGLFVLEALAAGVPVVQPDHGAFPEVLADTQGGLLHRPEDPQHLAERLHELLSDQNLRSRLASLGRQRVHTSRNARQMALRTEEALRRFISPRVASHQTASEHEASQSV
jgi:glycosyltransferase involved in cell wall biosynthesis